MQVEINTSLAQEIDWGATGVKEIVQNVINIIRTMKYEVAYDRTLGINGDFQDKPLKQAIPLVISRIYDEVSKREPRSTVKDVSFVDVDNDGNMNFKVVIEI